MNKGYKTTEFWLAVSTAIVFILVMTNIVPEESRDSLIPLISDILEKLSALILAASTIITYIKSRHELKIEILKQKPEEKKE